MKKIIIVIICFSFLGVNSCKDQVEKGTPKKVDSVIVEPTIIDDGRVSLNLNAMQKNHQLSNMRSHLEAVQEITILLSQDNYDRASEVAYTKLGSTTEMKLMCASFGDKGFEHLGLEFHKSADEMSEVFKKRNKDNSLTALSNTLNYCVQCHATYKQ
ncbi:cytochrome C [Winogradskyella helgolandensis]|uniref:cytochrome C n=1 Tax=Winogradskyella helgolandensis TaxID=2697010 RepID=UPI0015B890DC|nr:cytochrome C [Winogradskyella helgolandensis]